MKGVYLFLANGFEETEALATGDVLKRGGIPVKRNTCKNGFHL